MSFFHNLNKKLDSIAAQPAAAQLNERDMSRAAKGYEKYGKEGMQALAKAGREGKALDPVRKKHDKYDEGMIGTGIGAGLGALALGPLGAVGGAIAGDKIGDAFDEDMSDVVKKIGSGVKKVGQKALDTLGHGSDEDMIRDLQRKAGLPQTGKKPTGARPTGHPMDEGDMEEGNEFSGALQKAKATGQKEFEVDGKEYPVKETEMTPKQKSFAALAEPKDKITFADKIAGAKKEVDEMLGDVAAEAMRNALGNKKVVADEGWDEMTADVKRRASQPKVGDVTRGAKHDIKHTATGRIVTRRTDDQGMSVGSETDAEGNTPEKRGRGRPKGAPKGPERTTANAYKHKGERKVKEGEVSTGNLQKMHQLVTGLKSYIQDEDGQAALKELTALIKHYASQDDKQELDEKATSKKQQKFMGMVHAAQKGEKPASKEVGKVAKSMGKKDAEDFASTKHKGLPEKKKSDTKENKSTESESDNKEDAPKKSKSKFKFGGSVYESLDAQLETLINEGMSVTVNMSQDAEHGEDRKNITVNADGEDADRLAELLKMAGMSQQSSSCSSCGSSPCGCDMIDENSPNWPTDTETNDNAMQYSGGLNGPKSTGQSTTPVLASQLRRQVSMEQHAKVEQNLLNLYRTFGK
jgi:hypothetical protein